MFLNKPIRNLKVVFASIFLLLLISICAAKTWWDITPLKSTRSEVERSFGTPDSVEGNTLRYDRPEGVIFFAFDANPRCADRVPYETWNVSPNTVTAIKHFVRESKSITALDLDVTNFETVDFNSDDIGHRMYVNKADGLSIEVQNDSVIAYIYRPEDRQRDLRCPAIK